jgi:hypothetical protein
MTLQALLLSLERNVIHRGLEPLIRTSDFFVDVIILRCSDPKQSLFCRASLTAFVVLRCTKNYLLLLFPQGNDKTF